MMQTVGSPYYPMQTAPAASAVNIQIFEPKAYSGQPANNVANPIYAYPQQSMYSQPYMNQYQQYMPMQAPMYAPQMSQVQQLPQQSMPAPLLAQAPATEQAPVEQAAPQTPAAQPQLQVQQPTEQAQNAVDVNSLVAGLKSTDNKTQEDAITKIANLSQGSPEMQSAVLSEPVMRGLADIVKQDTSTLQGPTDAQVAAINKAATGAKLTPEEEALTKQLAPKTMADKNRVISMFTLAMLQKNQRDEIDRYNATQDPNNQLPQLKLNDLIGYTEIENAARNENEKEVKLAAIQALSYVARPEDKETIEPVLKAATNDPEPLIQQAANEVLVNIGAAPQAAAPAEAQGAQQQEPVDLSKMSRKERKAYEKAQKKAEKEAAKLAKQQGAEAQKAA